MISEVEPILYPSPQKIVSVLAPLLPSLHCSTIVFSILENYARQVLEGEDVYCPVKQYYTIAREKFFR